ncbi:MAG: hypothetical protein ACMZ63_09670 [Methylotenera sp.]
MRAFLKNFISFLLAISIVIFLSWLIYHIFRLIWAELISINPQLAVAVVAAATTLIASTATVMLGRYFERKKEVEAHFRAEKIKIYDEFLSELFKLFENPSENEKKDDSEDDLVNFLRQWQRKLILWGG